MKVVKFAVVALAMTCSAVFAAGYNDIKPGEAKKSDAPTAVEWQNANDKELLAATDEAVLAGFVEDSEKAKALLAKVKGAYCTDPIVAFQVGAVSQWVMGEEPCFLLFWKPSPEDGRKVWVCALLDTAEASNDAYVKEFMLDQLRWCGCKCPKVLDRIRKIGEKSGDKAVADMSALVLRELNGKRIGL